MDKLNDAKYRLEEKFRELEKIINRHNDMEENFKQYLKKILTDNKEKLEQTKLKLGIIGEFSTGKSTFINYLLGKSVLAVSDTPTTPIPIIIRHDKIEKYYMVDDKELKQEITRDEFHKCSSGENNDGIVTKHLEMYTPSEILERFNLEIVDTPGVNSSNPLHTERTLEILPELHAAVFLINAKKPGSKSTVDFINNSQEHLKKIFWCITKTNTVTEENAKRIMYKLPEIIKKQTGIIIENIFGLGFFGAEGERQLIGLDEFIGILEMFMVNEWENIIASDILVAFEKKKLLAKDQFDHDLSKMEEAFFKVYGSEPIGFFEASDIALEGMKQHIKILLNEYKNRAVNYAGELCEKLREKEYAAIDGSMFKTTLAKNTEKLPENLENLQNELSRKLDLFINEFNKRISDRYSELIKEKISCWDNFKEKIYIEMSSSIKNRLKYTILPNTIVSILITFLPMFLSMPTILIRYQFVVLRFVTVFALFTLLAISIKFYPRFFIRIKESKHLQLQQYANFYNYLTNRGLTNMGATEAFIKNVNDISKSSQRYGGMCISRGYKELGIATIAIGFLLNEFSGTSLRTQKKQMKCEIDRTCNNLLTAYYDTFDNMEIPMQQALSTMVDIVQERYKNILLNEIYKRNSEYLLAREPIDKFEMFLKDFNSIVDIPLGKRLNKGNIGGKYGILK